MGEWNGVCTYSTLTIPVTTPEAVRKKKKGGRGEDVLLLLTCCRYSLAVATHLLSLLTCCHGSNLLSISFSKSDTVNGTVVPSSPDNMFDLA